MGLLLIEFEWWRDSKGYRIVAAQAADGGGISCLPSVRNWSALQATLRPGVWSGAAGR